MDGVRATPVVELLAARLCHDLAGPIAAIGHGTEMLAEDVPEVGTETLQLVAGSAHKAASRLQFYRFAYGPDAGDAAPAQLAARFFAPLPIVCDYAPSVSRLPPALQRLGCNLLLVGAGGLPRGGRLSLDAEFCAPVLEVDGPVLGFDAELIAALSLRVPAEALTPRTVQAYFAGLLARDLGRLLIADEPRSGRFRIATARAREPSAAKARTPSFV